MQTQVIRSEVQSITLQQSLTAIKTLLRAGLGCITYLRDLLPEENFTQSQLVADEDSSISYRSSDTSFSSESSKQGRTSTGFKITTMARGYSDEGDKLLNYLENGIFDALQKEYLRSFIFAIHLDNKDPNNIVEAYTFNFHVSYHTVTGTNMTVPIMTLGEDLQGLTLGNRDRKIDNPVTEAVKQGKAPTLLDVKKSVKALLKTLIQATTQMDVLPRRRFATFKIFYTDKTPSDYEPPHFQAADQEKDRWYLMTHDLDEVPDKWSIGKVHTGHHSVNLSVTSIATYLPLSTPNNNAPFNSTTQQPSLVLDLSPFQEAALRAEQVEQQNKDAQDRVVAWSGEDAVDSSDIDGEAEADPDYVRLADGSYQRIDLSSISAPAGIRNNDTGNIEPVKLFDAEETLYSGVAERIPTNLNELAMQTTSEGTCIEQTQIIEEFTQDTTIMSPIPSNVALSSIATNMPDTYNHSSSRDVDMEEPKDTRPVPDAGIKTQHPVIQAEPIDSYETTEEEGRSGQTTPKEQRLEITHNTLDCPCGISIENECCFCKGGCGKWYHIWCMGYQSSGDPRLLPRFRCISCRLRADPSWPLVKINLYSVIMSRFQELALFRRAIKIAETKQPKTISEFAKAAGVTYDVGRRLVGKLEKEGSIGFLMQQISTIDEFGFPKTEIVKLTSGRKKGKLPRNSKKTYIFNREIIQTALYTDYFNPEPLIEARLLKIAELTSHLKKSLPEMALDNNHAAASNETQTQAETQVETPRNKRRGNDLENGADRRKKVKISISSALDLAE